MNWNNRIEVTIQCSRTCVLNQSNGMDSKVGCVSGTDTVQETRVAVVGGRQ